MPTSLIPRSATLQSAKRVVPLMLLLAAITALIATMTGPVLLTGDLASHPPGGLSGHCDGHQSNAKVHDTESPETVDVEGGSVTVTIDGDTVTFTDPDTGAPVTVEFCVKASNRHSGTHTGSEFTVDWTNRNGQPHDISYVVVYRIVDERCPGPDGDLTLHHTDGQTDPATNEVGDTHSVTATVTDEDGNACPDASVRFEVTGDGNPTPSGGTGQTDANGEAEFEFTNDEEGENEVTACTNDDGSLPASCAGADKTATVTKIWTSEPPICPSSLNLSLAPGNNPVNDVNTMHTKIATVTDQFGNNCGAGIAVRFEVDSQGEPDPDEAVIPTDQNGQAAFTYTNSVPGTDTVTACTTSDGDAPAACDTSQTSTQIWDTAGKTWVEPPADAFFCRADTATLSLVGDEILLLFEANEQSEPCEDDADGLLYALDPILGPTGLLNDDQQVFLGQDGLGHLLLDVLWSRTDASDGAHANSGVLYLALNDGSDDQVILELLTSSSTTDSDCNTMTTATVLSITLGGTPIEITGGNLVLIVEELNDLIILRLEDGNDGGADEGPDDTGAQAVDALILGAADLLGLTIADSESGCS